MTDITIMLPPDAVNQIVAEVTARVLATLDARADRGWPEWMGIETAARYLDCSPERIRKLVARRQIPYAQDGPGCRLSFNRHDLDTWLTNTSHQPNTKGHQ